MQRRRCTYAPESSPTTRYSTFLVLQSSRNSRSVDFEKLPWGFHCRDVGADAIVGPGQWKS